MLLGAEKTLERVHYIHLNVALTRKYRDQPLFDKVSHELVERGFEMISWQNYRNISMTGNAIFKRKESHASNKGNGAKSENN